MSVTTSRVIKIKAQPLTPEAFAPFGLVVDKGRTQLHCSAGQYTARVMELETAPERVTHINRHFDHSQLFVPLTGDPMLLVVAPAHLSGEHFDATQIRAFKTDGDQAFVFNLGTWHNAPRATSGDAPKVINVQGSHYQENTELINFEELTGLVVEVEL